MSDEEFLARWSRRKREAETVVDTPPTRPSEAQNPEQSSVTEIPADAEVDLSSLPPIESITGATDITAFLRKGIPAELSRAALRRAWAADPAIRDFVGLAENAWDFTDPTAMAGFGPLEHTPEQIASLVERVVGGVREATEKLASEIPNEAQNRPEDSETASSTGAAEAEAHPPVATTQAENEQAIAAVQPEGSGGEDDEAPIRQRL